MLQTGGPAGCFPQFHVLMLNYRPAGDLLFPDPPTLLYSYMNLNLFQYSPLRLPGSYILSCELCYESVSALLDNEKSLLKLMFRNLVDVLQTYFSCVEGTITELEMFDWKAGLNLVTFRQRDLNTKRPPSIQIRLNKSPTAPTARPFSSCPPCHVPSICSVSLVLPPPLSFTLGSCRLLIFIIH